MTDTAMTNDDLTICAGALYANGRTYAEISAALGVSEDRAVELAGFAADAQSDGSIGYMQRPTKGTPAENAS